ncbi:hypothetical protein EV360DRAFT_43679, partial [Lentinula raphanica]
MGVPREITSWMQRRYAHRSTRLSFDDFISDSFPVVGGEDQGDPFAAVGYILYAAKLMDLFRKATKEQGLGFMDDVAGMTWAESFDDAHKGLTELMERNNGVSDWARDHNCEFGFDKFKLVDFTCQRTRI